MLRGNKNTSALQRIIYENVYFSFLRIYISIVPKEPKFELEFRYMDIDLPMSFRGKSKLKKSTCIDHKSSR